MDTTLTVYFAARAPAVPDWFTFEDHPGPRIPHYTEFGDADSAIRDELRRYYEDDAGFVDLESPAAIAFDKERSEAIDLQRHWQRGAPERRFWAWQKYYAEGMAERFQHYD